MKLFSKYGASDWHFCRFCRIEKALSSLLGCGCLLNVTGFVNVSLKGTTRSEYGGLKLAWHRVLTLKMTNVVRL